MSTVNVAPSVSDLLDASPKRLLQAAHVVGAYVAVCLLCFALAYVGLNRREAASLRFLSHGTFLYAGTDHASAALAAQLSNRLHLRTINLLTPGAGAEVARLTGAH